LSRETIYKEEDYWSDVARRIGKRPYQNEVAGDDDPYHNYKRKVFLNHFRQLSFQHKKVLELGCGPGGNLEELMNLNPSSVTGVDISEQMLCLAKQRLPEEVILLKTNGTELPLPNNAVNISYSVTVLQHITTSGMVEQILNELGRVTQDTIYLCERTEQKFRGDQLNQGRTISFYKSELAKVGFQLRSSKYLNIQISYLVCGAIRRIFNNPWRAEGESPTIVNQLLQKVLLPTTRLLDPLVKQERDLTIMEFKKVK